MHQHHGTVKKWVVMMESSGGSADSEEDENTSLTQFPFF
jgi:hypothetical protein